MSVVHLLLALTSFAAAAIHFAVTGDHFEVHVAHGLFFAVVAWAQVLWGVGMLVRPGRPLLVAGAVGNVAVIVTWGLSRTVGVPIGPEPWTAEAVGVADLVTTALEIAIVLGCGALLVGRPDRLQARHGWRVPVLAFGLSLAVLSSAAIATVGDHSHAGSEASDHHASADAAAPDDDGHSHRLVGGSGEPDLAQIALIEDAMAKYRDVDVARADGWQKEHQDWPETGSHFYNEADWGGDSTPLIDGVALEDPEYLMYSKFLTGDWKLVAVAYVVDQAVFPEPPTELTGALYHEHVWNCIVDDEELEEEDWGVISREECEIMGGEWSPGGVWMTHVWLVENPNGIFAEENPLLVPLNPLNAA